MNADYIIDDILDNDAPDVDNGINDNHDKNDINNGDQARQFIFKTLLPNMFS